MTSRNVKEIGRNASEQTRRTHSVREIERRSVIQRTVRADARKNAIDRRQFALGRRHEAADLCHNNGDARQAQRS